MYPTPTVWSSHEWIALDDKAVPVIDALKSDKVQKLAWEKHGFRTGVAGAENNTDVFGVNGVAENITQVVQMPDYAVMDQIINALS